MNEKMEIAKALVVGRTVVAATEKYGRNATIPYRFDELMGALCAIVKHLDGEVTKAKEALREELSASNRRYAALNARHQKLVKRTGKDVYDSDADGAE